MGILKVHEIKYNQKRDMKKSLVNSFLISVVALLSLTIGVSSLLKGDWTVALFFVTGSMLGKWIAISRF
mgnify:CR=1 FL=1